MNDVRIKRKFTRNDLSGQIEVFSYSSQKFEHNSLLNYIFVCIGKNMAPVLNTTDNYCYIYIYIY